MDKKARVAGKNLLLHYREVFCNLEALKDQLFIKLQCFDISRCFLLSEEQSGTFVYIQLSKGSRRFDTSNIAFFDLNKVRGHFQTVAGFSGFCQEVNNLLIGRKFNKFGSIEICEEFENQFKEEIKEGSTKLILEDISDYISLQEQSTNYSSCRSPSSGIPSKESSLSSTTEKYYRDRILGLEEENLKLRSSYERQQIELKQKHEAFEKKMVEISSYFMMMQSQIMQLQEENQKLKHKT